MSEVFIVSAARTPIGKYMMFLKIERIPLSENIKIQISTFLSNNRFVLKAFNESQTLQFS